jgi:hypothetical protein
MTHILVCGVNCIIIWVGDEYLIVYTQLGVQIQQTCLLAQL